MATPSADGKSVTVVWGDTLWDIAQKYLGDPYKYKELATINNIPDSGLIYVGQTIKLYKDSGGSSNTTTSTPTKPTINQFGLLSNEENTLFATWNWDRSNTDSFKVLWTYNTGNGGWFVGSNSTITIDDDLGNLNRKSTYSIPSNARQVQFKVKPISKTYKSNDKEVNYWEASWSDVKTYTDSTPLATPGTPSVKIEKYNLTATLDGINISGATGIEFEVVKDNSKIFKTGKATIVTGHASYSCTVTAGGEYKVRCRAYNGSDYSDWSAYSSNEGTIPAAPSGITTIRATSKTSIYLEWPAQTTATSYDIEYSTKKENFDNNDQTTTKTGITNNHFELTGLESGYEYFARVRATNSDGSSGWSGIKSVVIGKDPAAPTTWSSTTTAITGEPLTLYWVHNTEDGSSQTFAELELTVNGVKETHTIENTRSEEERDKTSSYSINTSAYAEGFKIEWRVRTAGITKAYGDWSILRTVDIYAPATIELSMTDVDGDPISVLTSFPFYIRGITAPSTQAPIGYYLTIVSDEIYETNDNMGNPVTINKGQQVYSQYFDTFQALLVEFSANNIDLENNIHYTVNCVASMNSGLTAEGSVPFTVTWADVEYEPNAEIGIDDDSIVAYIRPYCDDRKLMYHKVESSSGQYTVTDTTYDYIYGEPTSYTTTTGERVYLGTTADGDEIYYCMVEHITPVTDVWLSVYRREFDGSFTELATGLDSAQATTITDPHPALDLARYRIVATSKATGAVSYYDPPGHPVGCSSIVIQWDEEWSTFETTEEAALEQQPWSGSLLKLPYNIDVSDKSKPDVALVEYVGRNHPVSYYGTQLGQTATWNTTIEKDDEETLYALRRLSNWMGDAYVREPSGSGYWANVTVSFNQKYSDLTIPVTLDIVRVEGGA